MDGVDIRDYLYGHNLDSEKTLAKQRPIFYYCNRNLMAIRYGLYKVHYMTSPIFYNDTMPANVSHYCPNGRPIDDWYVSQTCPGDSLTPQDPPLIYDMATDPFERFPLNETDFTLQLLQDVDQIRAQHISGIFPVPEVVGNYDNDTVPCCDEKCKCDRLRPRELVELDEQQQPEHYTAPSAVDVH